MSDRPVARIMSVGTRLLGRTRVPEDSAAIVLDRRNLGTGDVYGAGQTLPPGEFLVVPAGATRLTVSLSMLRTAGEETFTLSADLEVTFARTELDGELFRAEILGDRTQASAHDFERLFGRYVNEALGRFFRDRSLAEIAAEGEEVRGGVAQLLAEQLGCCGLSLVSVRGLRFGGEALRRFRRESERVEADRREQEREALARLAVGEQVAARRREEELRARNERLGQELAELRKLDAALQETDLAAQVFALRDEKLKADLYQLLLERQLSPEQIRARAPGRTRADVDCELEALKARVRQLLAEKKRVTLVAAWGEQICVWDVSPGRRPLDRGHWPSGFGPVRSVAFVTCDDTPAVACGTPRGVVVIDPDGGTRLRSFELPRSATHGVNGCAVSADSLWATHQEAGVLKWPLAGGDAALVSSRPGRGIAFDARGTAWAGVEGGVLAVDSEGEELVTLPDEVTAVVPAGPGVAAATAGGSVFQLEAGEDRRLLCGGAVPVIALAVTDRQAGPCILMSRKEHRIECRIVGGEALPAFIAPVPVSWIAATGTTVAGSIKGGRVLLWAWERPVAVEHEVSVPGEVRALALAEES